MAKSFFEVFPQLKLDTDLHGMLDDATVSKFPQRDRETLCVSTLDAADFCQKKKYIFWKVN